VIFRGCRCLVIPEKLAAFNDFFTEGLVSTVDLDTVELSDPEFE
jgi:hypothetical protein